MAPDVNLGDLTQIQTGKLDANASTPNGDYPFFTCAREPLRIASFSYDCECVLVAGNGDLNVKYYQGKFDAYQRTYIVQACPEATNRLHLRYVYHFLESHLETLRQQSIGGIIKYIKIGNLADAKIPLPPLAEQKRIARILDVADALRAKRREAITQLDTLLQSTFLEMFGDPFSESSTSSHVPFSTLTQRITYGFTSPMSHMESGIPILTAKNVLDGALDLDNIHYADQGEYDRLTAKSKPAFGDVLITKDGSIGRCAVVPDIGPLCINQSVALIIPDRSLVMPEYISAYIRSRPVQQRIQRMGKGNALKHLQITELARFPSVLPPLELQHHFATIVESAERQKGAQRAHLAELNALFASLQSRAFRGEL